VSVAIDQQQPVPLVLEEDGVIRVAGARVTLDSVIEAFEEGCTAEEIAQQYSTLRLSDIYSVIGYFLNHREEISSYLEERGKLRKRVREENEQRSDPSGVRERLLRRRSPSASGK
jgi:uncharacterized protein (DUF433 family)